MNEYFLQEFLWNNEGGVFRNYLIMKERYSKN